ncbi:hypothetical protein CfE428DRAFT_5984 [Chthoniobacter flavus Ellin428]|uniref:Uncharacterized protein n=1 Tax=Chthoniobacter flavus Ellin428 TaxID=497964 RepID=B4DAP3_9BACT|nr:hypothetical protein CfE428DRAFT_5984 [Chthoniobacter flavus Ellin428]TCO92724.1 hypothetical protein EV701_1051 [Chthoniobacter flavus]
MASMSGSVTFAQNNVGMDFSFRSRECHISDERKNLDLISYGQMLVIAPLQIEVSQGYVGKSADSTEMTALNFLLFGKRQEIAHHFVSFVENQCKSPFGIGL